MMASEPHDRLVTLTKTRTEFEANTLVAVLADGGIEAFAFGRAHSALPLSSRFMNVPVQVRERDLEAARAVMSQNVADSVDLDWDEVDVGEREDSLPLREPGRMPLAARIAFVMAVLVVIVTIIAIILALLG